MPHIAGWHIDGYGIFHDYDSPELADGLTVLLGPNEAGKSTLLSFIRGVLFGFKDLRARGRVFKPVTGGRHGGRLILADGEKRYVIDRDAGKMRAATVRLPDDSVGSDEEVKRLLGNVDATLFETVFAFSLSELQELATITKSEAAERIFSAGLVGAGKSAPGVTADLGELAGKLFKKSGRSGPLREVLESLERLDQQLVAARGEAGRYAQVETDVHAATSRLQELETELQDHGRLSSIMRDLLDLRPTWDDLVLVRSQLAALGDGPRDAVAVAELESELGLQRHRLQQLPDLRLEVDSTRAELKARLSDLGPGWDADRIAAFDTSLPARDVVRAWSERLRRAQEARVGAQQAHETAQRALREAATERERRAQMLPQQEPRSAAQIERAQDTLGRLRADMQEIRSSSRVAPSPMRWLPVAAALVLVTIGIVALVAGSTLVGALALAAGGVFAVLTATGRLRGAHATRDDASLTAQLRRMEASRAELDLSPKASFGDLEACDRRLREQHDARRDWDRVQRDLGEVTQRARELEDTATGAQESLKAVRVDEVRVEDEWTTFKNLHDAPPQLSPDGVIDFFATVERARGAAASLSLAEAALTASADATDEWEQRARAALGDEASSGGDVLVGLVAGAAQDLHRRRDLEQRAQTHESVIALRLGSRPDAETLRHELESGDPAQWAVQLEDAQARIRELEVQRVGTIERRRDAQSRLEALRESADVAVIDSQRESQLASLEGIITEWRTARLAQALVRHTLSSYVTKHQPQVLHEASRLFGLVTGGRYERVVRDATVDEIAVMRPDGTPNRSTELSRGAAEQLYLCLRLALAEEFAQRNVDLPLIMDDVLVNFDPPRAAATARVLAEVARRRQVLLFTCHPATKDLVVAASAGGADIVELAPPA
jgi:uncharacterized protein YhaN